MVPSRSTRAVRSTLRFGPLPSWQIPLARYVEKKNCKACEDCTAFLTAPSVFVCLPPHVYQYAGAVLLGNSPDLNADFDSCTFASNTAGTNVSSLSQHLCL
jgi:hypothetical protein